MASNGEGPISHHITRLESRQEVAEGTWSFFIDKPRGYRFEAGQFLELTLVSPQKTGTGEITHPFSISSAPYEPSLMVTTRMRSSAFKRDLASLTSGSALKITEPMGELILHGDSSRPAVMLAGGIGITPFRSILLDATHQKRSHELTLFSSNHRPEDAAFLDELSTLTLENPKFRMVATMTQMERSKRPWTGERGRIDAGMLSRHVADLRTPIFYVAGPPGMVRGAHAALNSAGVADASIHLEEFDGY